MGTKSSATPGLSMTTTLIRWGVYTCFFFSGATAIVFEVLWSRQFVTVFGNSAYAISIVLCAYMAGLGLGGLVGGWFADRITQRTAAYGIVQIGVAAWAMAIPNMLVWLRTLVPVIAALSPEALFVSTLARFAISFAILVVPCFLMGTTLPLLVRALTESRRHIGCRIGMLYCINTLGAAFGCYVSGFWMLDTIGLSRTNLAAVGVNIAVAAVALALSRPVTHAIKSCEDEAVRTTSPAILLREQRPFGAILLILAFINGMAGLACEVLWVRYLAFFGHTAYVFPTILCVYLLGIGLGGLVYSFLAGLIKRPTVVLGVIEIMLAISVIATFVISAYVYIQGPPPPLVLRGMALITVFLPTVLMGISFPLLCAVFGCEVEMLGRRTGFLVAVNTAGTVVGSLLPMFVLVPMMGIQNSIMLVSATYGVMGLALLVSSGRANFGLVWRTALVVGVVLLFYATMITPDLCQRVFLATTFNLYKHNEIQFYREGRTGTAIVTRNRLSNGRTLYINSVAEAPALYAHQLCFKMIGDLGPMLHPAPQDVLMICFGGGIAAGAATQLPEVKSLTVVDLESSVVDAATCLQEENNRLLSNPKTHVVIDDGRNYIMTSGRKWPVIVSDSTHPKSGDSWVLYTQEFYRLVKEHLTDDGVFVEWLPAHGLSTDEFRIIVRTFQSVFPHTSLWVTQGLDEENGCPDYTLLVASPELLKIDVGKLCDRLSVEAVRHDLEPFGLDTPAGFLDVFLCAEGKLRQWCGNGPVNTDDLPFTQYKTAYSKGAVFQIADLNELMEDIWPYLTNTGGHGGMDNLREKLVLRAKAARLIMQKRMSEAYMLLPDDTRYRQMRHLYEETSPRYFFGLAKMYWNDPKFLDFLISTTPYSKVTVPVYKQTLKINPKSFMAPAMLGVACCENGSWQEGEKYLRQAVSINPGYGAARFNLGLVLDKTGRHAEALQQWKEAATNAKNETSADQLGICMMKEGKFEEAVRWLRLALDINPMNKNTRLNLARALQKSGHIDEAMTHLRYVLKIDPQDATALSMLPEMETRDKTDDVNKIDMKQF